MRFLVALRHAGYARHLESTLRGLCQRGHEVVVLVGMRPSASKGQAELLSPLDHELDALADELDGLTVRTGVERPVRARDLGGALRSWLDFLRFLEPEFADAPKLRARAGSLVPAALREPTEAAAASPEFRAALLAMLRGIERLLPVPEPVQALVAEEQPDAVLVCPLLERRSPQSAYLRAAHACGIPGALCVASWDNLTTGALIHGEPDLVTVWNEAQRREATELHHVPPDRVAVTGAPLYDRWFERRPNSPREEFSSKVGLPADRPYVLYVCSSGFIAPDEVEWIAHWIDAVRNSGLPELAGLPVLIRPHPQNPLLDGSPAAVELERARDVAIHPREGAISISGAELADYYDSIFHAAAVVGVNTSAMIESAVVGRGVHVLLTPRYSDTQEGVPHFDHLRSAGGGLIEATRKVRKHAEGLARAVRGDDAARVAKRSRRFLQAFVRPHGMDRPATPLLIEQLERLAEAGRQSTDFAPPPPEEQLEAALAALGPIFKLPAGRRRAARPLSRHGA